MIIAVATEGNNVSQHFGRCPEYTLFKVKDGVVESRTVTPSPGHNPGELPRYLKSLGVSCVIAGGMGPRAQQLFEESSIRVATGVSGTVEEAVDLFLAGKLPVGRNACDEEHTGECGHHH